MGALMILFQGTRLAERISQVRSGRVAPSAEAVSATEKVV
jgi:hypothetical protein